MITFWKYEQKLNDMKIMIKTTLKVIGCWNRLNSAESCECATQNALYLSSKKKPNEIWKYTASLSILQNRLEIRNSDIDWYAAKIKCLLFLYFFLSFSLFYLSIQTPHIAQQINKWEKQKQQLLLCIKQTLSI